MNCSAKGREAQPCRSLGINNAECISDIDSDDCDLGSYVVWGIMGPYK